MSRKEFPKAPSSDEEKNQLLEQKSAILQKLAKIDEVLAQAKMTLEKPAILETLKKDNMTYREDMKKLNDQFELQLQQAKQSFDEMVEWFNVNTDIDTERSNISMLDALRQYLSEGYDMPPHTVLINYGIFPKCPTIPNEEPHHFELWLHNE